MMDFTHPQNTNMATTSQSNDATEGKSCSGIPKAEFLVRTSNFVSSSPWSQNAAIFKSISCDFLTSLDTWAFFKEFASQRLICVLYCRRTDNLHKKSFKILQNQFRNNDVESI